MMTLVGSITPVRGIQCNPGYGWVVILHVLKLRGYVVKIARRTSKKWDQFQRTQTEHL